MSEAAGMQITTDPSRTRYAALVLLCLAAAIAYLQRNCIGVAESTIRSELGLSMQQMGWALGGFFLTYALFQIPGGWLGERIGPRASLSWYSGLWSVATALSGLAGTGLLAALLVPLILRARPGADSAAAAVLAAAVWLYVVRLAGGAAQAGLFPCSAIVISQWYPQSRRAMVSGFMAAFQQVGAIAAAGLTGLLLAAMTWRELFVLYAVPGLLWAGVFYWWFRNRPQEHPEVNRAELALIQRGLPRESPASREDGNSGSRGTPWLLLLLSPPMWWICGQQFCRAAGYIFYASWFPTFLQETRGVTVGESGLLTMLPLITAAVGTAAAGTVSDWVLAQTGNLATARRGIAVFGMLGCAGLIFTSYFVARSVESASAVVLLISGGSFCAALAGPSGYATTIDMGGKNVATIFATMNMSGNIGATIFPVIVPWLQGLPGGWNLVLFVFGGVYVVAAGFWMLLNPAGTFAGQSLWMRGST